MLGLRASPIQAFDVTGLDGAVTAVVKSATKFNVVIDKTESFDVESYVVSTLVGVLPRAGIRWSENLFQNVKLADPTFATLGNVDIMLGGKVYAEIVLEGILKERGYLAQNTKFGWIISGIGEVENQPRQSVCYHTRLIKEEETPDEILKKFWEMEEPPKSQKKFTEEEINCEEVFKNSYRRMADGRVQVKLPFKKNPSKVLGESRNQAVARWLAMERKLEKDLNLKEDYMTAIKEHWELGHMVRASSRESDHAVVQSDGSVKYSTYYIPHHAVIKPESQTTKTRIVFDASAKSASKVSLNDILMIGPTIQESLLVRLVKWRIHRFVLRGDITKMYRQILVCDQDTNYQRIVFRFDKRDPIEEFELITLTFGTASAPYMAIRTLKQLAIEEEENFPIGAKVVKSDFHVDDLLTGGSTIEDVKEIYSQTRNLLKKAKMPMRKWSSNENKILEGIPEQDREIKSREMRIDDRTKTLGIGWLPMADYFFFKIPNFEVQGRLTKRVFLSQAAKLFDPLGWLGPVVMKPKIMFQSLWKQSLRWDDKISKELEEEWISFRQKLSCLEEVKIPRWYGFGTDEYSVELHGFGDASIKAYGAVVYVKSTDKDGNSQVSLVLAKSRVAPIQTVSLPRLELCGGLLLAELIKTVADELKIKRSYCWTDSSITLHWVNSSPDKYKTFVANRIAEIQALTDKNRWRHVAGTDNPADCLSRGIDPDELKEHELWRQGPKWLLRDKEFWPKNANVKIPEDMLEYKGIKTLVTSINSEVSDIISRFGSFQLLTRVMARIRRLGSKGPRSKALLIREIEAERIFWIKIAQEKAFGSEVKALKERKVLNSGSKLLRFDPFLDSDGILRVGGRLKEALIDYHSKHQIIIPKDSHVTKLIVNDAHKATKHGGTQLTMTYTQTQYWIVDTRNVVRNLIRKCVTSHRYSKQVKGQLMGNLPEPRVNMSRAFLHTGVDYAGPISVLTRRKPGKREVTKGYIALFVCLCTKAIHLELVSDQTTKAYMAAFKRFYCRRGLPSNMYSDNGTTFVGAKNELDKDYQVIKEIIEPKVAEITLNINVQWSFIPPSAPHFGGLWEAGVKSMKFHIKRMISDSVYTFEETTTMLAEIEACLNSRPLCPVTNDPEDFSVLTPAHFLIGDNLLPPPGPAF